MKPFGKIRLLTVLTGILTALLIVFTQLFYFEISRSSSQEQETEQQSNSSNEEESISLPSSYSLPASTHVVLNHEFSFIEELLFDGEKTDTSPVELTISTGSLFKTLFHFIISPNAP